MTDAARAPRKLKPWEVIRVAKRYTDEIHDRTTGRFSRTHCCGDPGDIVALEAALAILYWHTETLDDGASPARRPQPEKEEAPQRLRGTRDSRRSPSLCGENDQASVWVRPLS